MKKAFTILCLLFVTAYAHASDHILMVLKETNGSNIVYVLDDDDFNGYHKWTDFLDYKDPHWRNGHKSSAYMTGDGYYAFIDLSQGRQNSDAHQNAMEDYRKLEKQLKGLFPGIITVIEEWRDYPYDEHRWCAVINFQKNVTFVHPIWTGGKPISCEIETLYVN